MSSRGTPVALRTCAMTTPTVPGFWSSRRLLARRMSAAAPDTLAAYWTLSPAQLLERLGSGDNGLSPEDAAARLRTGGPNRIRSRQALSRVRTLAGQVRSPL